MSKQLNKLVIIDGFHFIEMAIARGVDFLPSQIWEALMHHCSADVLVEVTSPLITPWLSLLVTPTSLPVDSSLLVGSLAQPSVSCVCVSCVCTCVCTYMRTCMRVRASVCVYMVQFIILVLMQTRVCVCVCVCVCVMQGSGGVKEVFLGGSLGIESTVSKQMATFAARVSGTK